MPLGLEIFFGLFLTSAVIYFMNKIVPRRIGLEGKVFPSKICTGYIKI